MNVEAAYRKLKQAVTKPERSLGAPFIDNCVGQRQNVALCEECWRKYWGWWERANYRPNWNTKFTSNCDGCSKIACLAWNFVPEERFKRIYTERHEDGKSPRRRLFF